jgi:hypothetical protein
MTMYFNTERLLAAYESLKTTVLLYKTVGEVPLRGD